LLLGRIISDDVLKLRRIKIFESFDCVLENVAFLGSELRFSGLNFISENLRSDPKRFH